MRLTKGASVWVAERRGTVVYTRGGRVNAPGVPKAKEFRTEAAAEAHLRAERDKRLADGFLLQDATASLDAPFTADGAVSVRPLPARVEALAEAVRARVRWGFLSHAQVEDFIDSSLVTAATRPASSWVREQLSDVAREERRLLFARACPRPCINDAIDRAFDVLTSRGIIALQAAGFTQRDGWAEVTAAAAFVRGEVSELRLDVGANWVERVMTGLRALRGQAVFGGAFFHEQDVERAVLGQGLMVGFGSFSGDDAAIASRVLQELHHQGIEAHWSGDPRDRISISPFEWYVLPKD